MSPVSGIGLVGDERGFTLVELLVAMVGAIVIVFAAFSIYIVALHQSTRISDRVQVDQIGRSAMTTIVEELHSSCLQKGLAPIRPKSTPEELLFVDGDSKEAQISSSVSKAEAYEDRVVWKPASSTLTDERYPVESGTVSNPLPEHFVYATTPSAKRQLATNVTESTAKGGGKVPIFQYYEYAAKATTGSATEGVTTLQAISLKAKEELGETRAKKVAAVTTSFTVAPREANQFQEHEAVPFANEVILAFGLPASEATIEAVPCQ